METLEFTLSSRPAAVAHPPTLRGVVASGNLEVLIVPAPAQPQCTLVVNTSARGFGDVWRAVLDEFAAAHPVGQLSIVVNDMGATPAVVMLRLEQALAAFNEGGA
jgi:malonate decarboxylase delta subunit